MRIDDIIDYQYFFMSIVIMIGYRYIIRDDPLYLYKKNLLLSELSINKTEKSKALSNLVKR